MSGSNVTGYAPSTRLRATIPLGERSVVQVTARFESSLYDVKRVNLFGPQAIEALGVGTPERYWGADLSVQGGYLLAQEASVFFPGESWSLLWELDGDARWQGNAFGDSLSPGATVGFGYETPRLRLALGLRAEGRRGRSGFDLGPIASVRWRPTDRITLRNRGFGAQAEFALSPTLELFLAGYRTGHSYLMEPGSLGLGSITFTDQQVRVGGGFEWRISRWLRLNLEAGVLVDHQFELDRVHGPTLSKVDADAPSAYFTLRFEVRPQRRR
jgi:hypothetical protein